jgi:flagellar motor switch protein FliG
MLGLMPKNNVYKVAVLLTLLGREAAQEVMKQFDPDMVERIGKEMLKCGEISKAEGEKVLREFIQEMRKIDTVAEGGASFVKAVLAPLMRADRAERILGEIQRSQEIELFKGLREVDPEKLIAVLHSEHPQAIALVLANLPSEVAGTVMMNLSTAKQGEVMRRLAILDKTQPDIEMAREIERRLLERLENETDHGKLGKLGGVQNCADILNQMDKTAVHRILEEMESKNVQLAEEIKQKLVRFDDIVKLEAMEIQRVLKEVETQDLATALIKASKEVEDAVFKNMSHRGADMLKEDIEVMHNVKAEVIRGARLKIAEIMRRLDEEGVVVLNKGSVTDEVV